MNLPVLVDFGNNKYIEYTYDATGMKLRKRVRNVSTFTNTDYAGNYIYENDVLQFFNTAEGYVSPKSSGGFDYIYQHKDHLGNVRLSYTENPNAQTTQTVFSNSFENMADWDRTGNTFGWALSALDSSKKKTGTYSGRIDDNYPTHWGTYVNCDIWTPINNATDTDYTFSAWVFVEDIPNNDARVLLMTRRAGETGYPTGNYQVQTTKRGQWEYIERTVSVPADVRELNFRIDNNKDGTVWFDDVKIVKGNTARTLIVEESNYYPFGLKHKGYNSVVTSNGNSTAQKFKFQNQELTESLGYDMLEFELRHYDATLGRFVTTDPYGQFDNPYLALGNSPVISVDPNGGKCFDINGNEVACPEGKEWDEYRNSDTNHNYILPEFDLTEAQKEEELEKYWESVNALAEINNKLEALRTGNSASNRIEDSERKRKKATKLFQDALLEFQKNQPPVVDILDLFPVGGNAKRGVKPVASAIWSKQLNKLYRKLDAKIIQKSQTLIEQLVKGNLNPGSGSKWIYGTNGKKVFQELRSSSGARVYFRETNGMIEILGISNKKLQDAVINQIIKQHGF